MSGGVDSSVSAHLIKQQHDSVAGMFMKNWEEDDRYGTCPAEQDADDARQVAERIGIKLYTRNFAAEYWDNVFEHFLAEYQAGRTPNPDILCNREIKFKTFLDHAEDLGGEKIATGHYARVDQQDGYWRLLRGVDNNKDQSYFLYTLGQAQLSKTLFPVGELEKPRVRELASELGLHVAGKKDSTGVCFIGEQNFRHFLERYLERRPGPMIDTDGRTLGEHVGLAFYTLGQRQGLGIGGQANASNEPWYVIDKDLENNALIVAQGHDNERLASTTLWASELSWTDSVGPDSDTQCSAKTRYRQADQQCRITRFENNRCKVVFDHPQRAVTPGQSVVFYRGDQCLGGGVIDYTDAPSLYAKPESGQVEGNPYEQR
ncbi:MAG: tRNA-specific 2-thiouridylase MnmA [Lysobacteraceae bacterium]|nr:MAG: tRNA-specific 2-thiouridylase MnmA [Xanthomonadaceae bacterium]